MLKWILNIVLSVGIVSAAAADCPVDNFDDGNDDGWIHCGDWSERQSPVWDASMGSYCLGLANPLKEPPPPPLSIAAEWTHAASDPRYANGCVRAGFTAGTEADGTWSTHFVLGLRADCKNAGYKAMLGPSLNRISIFRRLEMLADSFVEPFEQGQAYRAEFCAVGPELSLKVWQLGTKEPAKPQLTATNDLFKQGNIGIGVFIENDNRGPIVQGCFDDIRFEPAPQCPGDLDCNGLVDGADLRAVAAAWGSYEPCFPRQQEDLDGNCAVGFSDVVAVAKAFGDCATSMIR